MEISKETKKRIKAETEYASSAYASSFHPSLPPARKMDLDFAYNKGYEEGKTSEATRAQVLIDCLLKIRHNHYTENAVDKKIDEAISQYNNSK